VLGVGLALIAAAAGLWLFAWWRYGDVPEYTSREASDVRGRFEAEVAVPGEITVDLDEGVHLVYAVVPGDEDDVALAGLTAELTGPDGEVGPAGAAADGSPTAVFQGAGTEFDLVLLAELDVRSGGEHTLRIEGDPPAGVTTAGIVEAIDRHEGADAILAGSLLFVLGLLVGGVGAFVALIGGLWLLISAATRGRT
jgi:4-amino-4-deoxy-L-arabinose transferase-like glycosyltransferase